MGLVKLSNYAILVVLGLFWVQLVASAGLCGNGVINSLQECDDNNSIDGDGCSSLCKIQPYYRCDTSSPNNCKIDSVITLTILGNHRSTSSNTVTFLFKLNEQFPLFNSLNFHSIFTTTIPYSQISVQYTYSTNILSTTFQFTSDIENTQQSFQLKLALTPYFWFDSGTITQELHGVNCQLTFQNDLWMHNIMLYVVIGIVVIVLGIGVASIFFEKWIGLELIQTYQSVFFLLLLMQQYPFEFSAINEGLKYANGYDNIIAPDYNRTYSLSSELNGVAIEKEFLINFNVNLGLLALNAIILGGLVLRKAWLKHRQQSQLSRSLAKNLEKTNRYFTFMFGQVFIMLVLTLMFKIMVVFIVQLSSQMPSVKYFNDQTNISLALISFLILFSIIIYIINWYIMIPDTLSENQQHMSLQFRNMKFYYPVIYLIYQSLYISIIAIYYRYDFSVYIVLSMQIAYFLLILLVWPYNTPRMANRILHNVSILFNQFISIFIAFIILRWRVLLPGELQVKSNYEFKIYTFVVLGLLIIASVLTVIRLAIFNKEVQCCQRQENTQQEKDIQQMKPFQKDDHTRFISHQRKRSRKESFLLEQPKPINSSKNQEEELIGTYLGNTGNQIVNQFLNDKYITWSKDNLLDIQQNKQRIRMRNIKKTNGSKQAQLIKSPIQQYFELKKMHQASVAAIRK